MPLAVRYEINLRFSHFYFSTEHNVGNKLAEFLHSDIHWGTGGTGKGNVVPIKSKVNKSKAVPVTGRGGPWGCEMLRMPHCLDQWFPNFFS
jgi:hypothetical protein